jgi:hypothetical protein
MPDDKKPIHKLIIKPQSAQTACGLTVIAYYPMSNTAMGDEAGQDVFNVTVGKQVTCQKCKERMKENDA